MFDFNFTDYFDKKYKRVTKGNKSLKKQVYKSLNLLSNNPEHPSLKSHPIRVNKNTVVWSSWVNKSIRIIWNYSDNQIQIIDLLDIGPHDGSNKVY